MQQPSWDYAALLRMCSPLVRFRRIMRRDARGRRMVRYMNGATLLCLLLFHESHLPLTLSGSKIRAARAILRQSIPLLASIRQCCQFHKRIPRIRPYVKYLFRKQINWITYSIPFFPWFLFFYYNKLNVINDWKLITILNEHIIYAWRFSILHDVILCVKW